MLFMVSGCAKHAPPRNYFPLGFYGVDDPKDFQKLVDAGFNAAQSYPRDAGHIEELAREARRAGVRLLVAPQDLMKSTESVLELPMGAWYLVDEPDVQKIAPQTLADLDRRVKAWSPDVPTALVVGQGSAASRYAADADILMVDWYPVPHLPLESLGDNVKMTADAAGGKPVWAVIQAFNWRDSPRDPRMPYSTRVGRFPTWAEIRFMSYDAVLSGASGLWYFIFHGPGAKTLADDADKWATMTAIGQEMSAMRPIFENGTRIALPFAPDPYGVAARAWRWHGRDYVVIANRRRAMGMRVPTELLDMRWRPLFERRRYAKELLDHVGEGYDLPPYRVMVFESRLW
jgi:hypothetical protein